VKRGVLQAGGFPLEMPALALAEVFQKPTTMLYRNLLAMEAEEVIRCHPVDAVVLKPMVLGGLLRALEWARLARARGLRAIVTTSLDGTLGRLGAAQLAAALLADGPMPDAGLATARLLENDVCEDPAPPAHGRIELPETPGLGAP